MNFAKTIKMFLIDGEPNGRMTIDVSNWSGRAYKIPRIKIKQCSDRDDLKHPGIYFLFGKDEKDNDIIYIGEAEPVYNRLLQHLASKEFWNEAIVFISNDKNLNKAHIKYLESRFYEIGRYVNRYHIVNSTTPTKSSIAESDRAEMEEFIEYIKILINVLGHKVFEDRRETGPSGQYSKETFYIKGVKGEDAQGMLTSGGFLVLSGSKAASAAVSSMFNSLKQHRDKLIENNKLILKGDCYEFIEDIEFSSPSTAAATILGRTANGLIEWKLKDGTTLRDFETRH
jgi:hypothetical protein